MRAQQLTAEVVQILGHLRIFRPIIAEVVQKWGHLRTGTLKLAGLS